MHPIVHRWTAHIQNDEENREFLQLAMIVVGSVVPSSNKVSFQKQVPPAASEDAESSVARRPLCNNNCNNSSSAEAHN